MLRWVIGALPFAEAIEQGSGGEPFAIIKDPEDGGILVITKALEEVEGDKSSTKPGNEVNWER